MKQSVVKAPFLVIGYGNELRGDDAVGPLVARQVEALALPGVRVLIYQQLAPEVADEIAHACSVVFVDAAVDVTEVSFREVAPCADANIIAHSNSPAVMLGLAEAAFGAASRAWSITIPVKHLGFTEELSPAARREAAIAVEHIKQLVAAQVPREDPECDNIR